MKHTIRQRVINEFGLPVTKVETINCELGSDIRDKHGKEIIEGDIVEDSDGERSEVWYSLGAFILSNADELVYVAHDLEIVGHVSD